jgi:hypothetical protein
MRKHSHHTARSKSGAVWLLPHADTLGMIASLACLVHCVAMPLLLMAMPALAPNYIHNDYTHFFLAFFVASFCLLGILPGYLRHSRMNVLVLMVTGLSLVLFATFAASLVLGERFEMPIITAGNLLVVLAHYRNRRLLACNH